MEPVKYMLYNINLDMILCCERKVGKSDMGYRWLDKTTNYPNYSFFYVRGEWILSIIASGGTGIRVHSSMSKEAIAIIDFIQNSGEIFENIVVIPSVDVEYTPDRSGTVNVDFTKAFPLLKLPCQCMNCQLWKGE